MNTHHNQNEYSALLEQPQNQNQPIYVAPTSSNENDGITAVILFVIGFFVCITWPICYCLYRKSDDQLARILAILSLILTLITVGSIVISIALSIVIFVFWIIIIIAAGVSASQDDDYYHFNALKNIFQK
ncbi:Transmembrane protein [Entamoeba marina]